MIEQLDFTGYLKHRQLSPRSMQTYQRYVVIFFKWMEEESISAKEITYTDLLSYVCYCHKRGLKQDYINKLLGAVRHYFNYLKYTQQIQNSPAAGLYIRGKQRAIPHNLLAAEQMEDMYNGFTQKGLAGKRNKIILGLMIYQGLNTNELEQLEPGHLKLREGKIDIPRSRRGNRRILKLEAHQMIDLQEYVSKTRVLILEIIKKQNDKLFISIGGSDLLYNSIDRLVRILQKQYDYFINAQQLRQSRIAIWVKQYDIRQVQYMIGHKYVSSTERYQSTNLNDLQKDLEKHYPVF